MNEENKKAFRSFPQEMPKPERKQYENGIIENVVKNEIYPKASENPVTPANTDSINTEFAQQKNRTNM